MDTSNIIDTRCRHGKLPGEHCWKCNEAQYPAEPESKLEVGDWVTTGSGGKEYEIAEIRVYPHGPMVGIYDEPPGRHVDFWNLKSLTLSRRRAKYPAECSRDEFVRLTNADIRFILWALPQASVWTHEGMQHYATSPAYAEMAHRLRSKLPEYAAPL